MSQTPTCSACNGLGTLPPPPYVAEGSISFPYEKDSSCPCPKGKDMNTETSDEEVT